MKRFIAYLNIRRMTDEDKLRGSELQAQLNTDFSKIIEKTRYCSTEYQEKDCRGNHEISCKRIKGLNQGRTHFSFHYTYWWFMNSLHTNLLQIVI